MKNVFAEKMQVVKDFFGKYPKSFLALFILASIALPFTGVSDYVIRVVIMIGIYSMLALGLNLLTGYTGQVSLGNAGFYAIGAYTSALLSLHFHLGFFTVTIIAAVVAALFGLILGIPTLRLTGTYLSIATLGFGEITRLVILNWEKVTNGALGLKNIERPKIFGLELTLSNNGLYFLMVALVALTAVFCYLIINSKVGRAFISIKEDELASTLMGIKTTYYKVLAFVLSAFISGIAGSFYAHMIRFIEPNSFTFDTSIMIISIVILGGMGTIRGMFFGSAILVAFPEILRPLQGYRFVVYGLILVIMMRFRPQGALGWKSKKPYKYPKGVNKDGKLAVATKKAVSE